MKQIRPSHLSEHFMGYAYESSYWKHLFITAGHVLRPEDSRFLLKVLNRHPSGVSRPANMVAILFYRLCLSESSRIWSSP